MQSAAILPWQLFNNNKGKIIMKTICGSKLFVRCLFFVIAILFLAVCSQKESTASGKETIRISGAWALYPMMVKWAEEYQKINPNIRIDVSAGGAGKGIADSLAGLVDIGMVSRNINPEEIKQGAAFIPVVKDAVFPTMNAGNADTASILKRGLNRDIFTDLWILEKPLTWGQIVKTGSTEKVQVYTRSDACGAAETWAQYLGKKQEDLKGVAVYGDPGVASAIKKDINGIGFNNLNYAYDSKTGLPVAGLQVIPIDVNGNGKIDPQEDLKTKQKAIQSIIAGIYPSPPARDLYLVTKNAFKGQEAEFVKWILTDGQKYVNEVGYIKISNKQIIEAKKKVKP
jgi:phosphate transport system substrate-binding protein